ncbi:hypothetical protein [Nitrosopumilus adriaticus]|uniref:Guanylate cyclase domain-containing protein n=1 Tax=Nitrosopumilus adriaticus TaxID=1580092 RepID=A0A0D5C2W8_9ARCH|nr:hypothetical protein [Nitrosopumilus adriaticus]AJW70685.1 hypothetical protein NADRNF5_0994 [Nitrosopumilus adriaticus]
MINKKHRNSNNKVKKIAEIQGRMEEYGKTKDWLLEELKKNRITLKTSPTSNSYEILNSMQINTVNYIHKLLKLEEFSVSEVKTLTKTLHWFFTDIVGSSNPKNSTKAQIRKISILNQQIQNTETFKKRDVNTTVILPTGDGVAIGFSESPEQPLRLATDLHKLLNKYNKTHRVSDRIFIRIGLDTGPVYFIKDIENEDTVWGPGIIMARRVMDLCEENQIFASGRIGDDISKLAPEYESIMHPIGEYQIKHGDKLSIYNIFGKTFGNKHIPKKDKINLEEDADPTKKFEFKNIEIRLDVSNTKNMMTHHTWVWDVKNISKKPLTDLYYEIGGEVPKDNLKDINLTVKDKKGNKLRIGHTDTNKPLEKKFLVELAKPIKHNKSDLITLEYDWEEPDRIFEYVFLAKCKKFKYVFKIPKNFRIEAKALKINQLGEKILAKPPPQTNVKRGKTEIVWKSLKNKVINVHDCYQFRW